MRILVSGGGSAGHIAPILATVDALKSLDSSIQFLYVGQKGGMEARIAFSAGLSFEAISAGKYRRNTRAAAWRRAMDLPTHALNARDLGRFGIGFGQSLGILRRFKPDIIFIKGGFVGLPVGLAARVLRIPYIIHESDLIPGLANKLLAKGAAKIAVGFPVDRYKMWPREKLIFTGNPIRKDITAYHRLEGIAHFKLDTTMPVILVTGGSQGARAINNVVVKALPELLERYQVIHIAGEKEYDRVNFDVKKLGLKHAKRYVLRAFLVHDLGLAYAAADLVIGRAGAGTIAELAALAKPSILIPNDGMAGHQVDNAKVISRAGAAKVIPEVRLNHMVLTSQINQLFDSEQEQELLVEHIKEFGVPDGARRLAETILELAPQEELQGEPGERGEE